jgi:hypothetical protein
MSKIAVSSPAAGTATYTISAPAGSTDRTITLPDASGTILTTATAGVPVNGPAFRAYASSSVSITGNVSTKVPVNTVEFDTNSAFDTVNQRFKPSVAGYYQINFGFESNNVASGYFIAQLKKNGTTVSYSSNYPSDANFGPAAAGSALVYLNGSTDYVELFAQSSASRSISGNSFATLNGFLARSAT